VLAEGEATGHAHVIESERASLHASWDDTWFLRVDDGEPVLLVHQEHDPLVIPAGAYEVRRQREYTRFSRTRGVSD
jgi:hypothetical protein